MDEDGEGLEPEHIALYLEDEDKRALLRFVIKGADSEDSKESADSCAITFLPEYFLSDVNCTN